MTYWGYHLLFTIPLIIALVIIHRKRLKTAHVVCWAVVCAIAFAFTTPWDNYAVFLGIWGFGEDVSLWYPLADLADQTPLLGWIPFEEYSFFILESTIVCLIMLFFLPQAQGKNSLEKVG
ncbi:MAG: hypothetical protein AAGF10_04330 [Verrucomicrobiota bacterium]